MVIIDCYETEVYWGEYWHACKLERQQEKGNLIEIVEEAGIIMTHFMPVDVLDLIYMYHLSYSWQWYCGA